MSRPSDHPPISSGRIGVLLINLGTPEDLSPKSVRRYLKEFLWDRRVVEIPRIVWWFVLNLIVLNTRPKKSAAAYAKIWRHEENESPLRHFTRELTKKLAEQFPDLVVDFAMRYGEPSIAEKMRELQGKGCDRLLIVPLYPQYSATTNASVLDAVYDHLKSLRWQPTLRVAHPWYGHEKYIESLRAQVQAYQAQASEPTQKLLLSFHGLPKFSLDKGDPYYCQCQKTGRLLAESLNMPAEDVIVSFQSRFGPAKWLEPYTSDTLEALGKKQTKNLLVMTPGFATDCLETLEEIAMEGVETFEEAGGQGCTVLPCLNDSEGGVDLMKTIVTEELAGWR